MGVWTHLNPWLGALPLADGSGPGRRFRAYACHLTVISNTFRGLWKHCETCVTTGGCRWRYKFAVRIDVTAGSFIYCCVIPPGCIMWTACLSVCVSVTACSSLNVGLAATVFVSWQLVLVRRMSLHSPALPCLMTAGSVGTVYWEAWFWRDLERWPLRLAVELLINATVWQSDRRPLRAWLIGSHQWSSSCSAVGLLLWNTQFSLPTPEVSTSSCLM